MMDDLAFLWVFPAMVAAVVVIVVIFDQIDR
jgi:hypothetical protein